MKKFFSLALAALMLAASAGTAVYAADAPAGEAIKGTPTIDGKIDDAWANAPVYSVDRHKDGRDTGLKSTFSAMWDETALYVLIIAEDSDHSFEGGPSVGDGMEVYLDLNNEKTAGFDDDGQAYFAMCANDAATLAYDGSAYGKMILEDAASVAMTTEDGRYIYEVKILDEAMEVEFSEGMEIGFDIQVNDQASGETSRSGAFGWSDSTNKAWESPEVYGTLTLVGAAASAAASAEAPAATTAPAADAAWVTEGLAALYDGANNANGSQDKETAVWKDSSGNGIDFEVDLDDSNYWTDNAFHANSAWCYFDDAIVDVVNGDKFSVEIVFGEFTGYGASFNTFLNSDNDNFAWFIRNDGDFLEFKNAGNSRPKVAGGMDFVNNSTLTITFDLDECECLMYVDGELIGEQYPVSNVGADTMFLAHADASRNWEADVHCIRFYNTALTAEQIAANVAADQAKYFTAAAPAVETPVEETPAEEPAVEETPAEEPAAEEVPAAEPAAEEVPVEEPAAEEAPAEEPAEETVEEEAPAAAEVVEEAPQTFDFGVIAAVAAIISAAGYALSKKSR